MIRGSSDKVFRRLVPRSPGCAAKDRIVARLRRIELGNFGDAKFFEGIGELRVAFGPGYRVYFVRRGGTVVILLCGGDKGSQRRDIERAKAMKDEME